MGLCSHLLLLQRILIKLTSSKVTAYFDVIITDPNNGHVRVYEEDVVFIYGSVFSGLISVWWPDIYTTSSLYATASCLRLFVGFPPDFS